MLARLAITTATELIHKDKTDEGYRYESNFKIGINYLAIELIIKTLTDNSEKRENIVIGDVKPFKSSIVVSYNENKTVFEILSQNISLYNEFQYGQS